MKFIEFGTRENVDRRASAVCVPVLTLKADEREHLTGRIERVSVIRASECFFRKDRAIFQNFTCYAYDFSREHPRSSTIEERHESSSRRNEPIPLRNRSNSSRSIARCQANSARNFFHK